MPQFRESDMDKFNREYIFRPVAIRIQRDDDYVGEVFDWELIKSFGGVDLKEYTTFSNDERTSLSNTAKNLYLKACETVGEDPEDSFVDFCELMDVDEYIANVGMEATENLPDNVNAVMCCGFTAYTPSKRSRPVGLELAGVVESIYPDSIKVHISCMD